MANFRNDFEHTTPGTTATYTNAGDAGLNNDAFSTSAGITLGAGATATYEIMPWGGVGLVITNGSAASYSQWREDTRTELRSIAVSPIYLEATPGSAMNQVLLYTNSSLMLGGLQINTARKLQITGPSGTVIAGSTSDTVLGLNTKYVVEFAALAGDGSTGALEYYLYAGNHLTLIENKIIANITTLPASTPARRVRFGANTSSQIAKQYWDDLQFAPKSAGVLGPLTAEPPTAVVTTQMRAEVRASNSTVPGGELSYAITQTAGPAVAPELTTPGLWLVTPHATESLTYQVVVTGSLGGSDTESVVVPPLEAPGVSSPVLRFVKIDGEWV